jgi:hypothetical protein
VGGAVFPQWEDKSGPKMAIRENLFWDNGQLFGGATTCEIIEIKPDTPKAKARGEAQVLGYVKMIEDMWMRERAVFDRVMGLDVFKKCVDASGKLKLSHRVLRYPICERDLDLGTYEWG